MSIIADVIVAAEPLLTSSEVADLFRVDPKSVARWARTGAMDAIRLPGGGLRFRESVVAAALANPAAVLKASGGIREPAYPTLVTPGGHRPLSGLSSTSVGVEN